MSWRRAWYHFVKGEFVHCELNGHAVPLLERVAREMHHGAVKPRGKN